MSYKDVDQLPDSVRESLPDEAQGIYLDAFNRAWDQFAGEENDEEAREAAAHQEAWTVVRETYRQENNGRWVLNTD